MNNVAIIVAGGSGSRMGGDIPKQFIPIGKVLENKSSYKPILMHTIHNISFWVDDVILVLPKVHVEYWKDLCAKYHFNIPHKIKIGGATRFHSVLSGLEEVDDNSIVLIHDGVRPFVSASVVKNLINTAKKDGAAIPYVDMIDSIRAVKEGKSVAVDRSRYIRIQTPQVFCSSFIKRAYSGGYKDIFTDDASVYEYYIGDNIGLVLGNVENIKITSKADLYLAEAMMANSD